LAIILAFFPFPVSAQSKLPEAMSLTDADREVLVSDAAGRPSPIFWPPSPKAALA
jgi:hypothetical protein